jgi:tRNA dimethylallyltransferase
MAEKPKIIVILGPTASGKSDLAVEVAIKINGEIISADSRQVYKGMDIGSGKITKKEMKGVPHYLLDVISPMSPRPFTVARYQQLAKIAIKKIIAKGKVPIICGGTGFYIDSLIYDYEFPQIPPNAKIRNRLEKESAAELFKRLKKLDPGRAKNIDRFNKRRLIRALEIIISTKKPVSPLKKSSPYDVIKIGVARNRDELKKLISKRLKKRLKAGMAAEIKNLRRQGVSWQKLDDFGLEYRFVSRYLRGLIPKEKMLSQLEKEIIAYAKRQMTWFKRDPEIFWIKNQKSVLLKIENFIHR